MFDVAWLGLFLFGGCCGANLLGLVLANGFLFVPKQLTLDYFVNDVSYWVVIFACPLKNLFNDFSICELDFFAGRISNQTGNEVACDLFFVFEQVCFELDDARKILTAGSHSTWVDRRALEWWILGNKATKSLAATVGSIVFSVTTNWVEAFQRKSGWINLAMALVASFDVAVSL